MTTETTQQIMDLLNEPVDTNDQGLEDDQDAFEGEEFNEEVDEEFDEESEGGTEDDEPAVDSWGAALGIEEDKIVLDDNGLVAGIKTKVDGEETVVPLKDLVQGYQFNAHNTRTAQALAQQKQQLAQEQQAFQQRAEQDLQLYAQLANVMAQQVLGDYANIDWDKFMQEQPEQARAAYGEFRKRDDYFKGLVGAVQQQLSETQAQQQAQAQQQQLAFAQQQAQELLVRIPEWQDINVAKENVANIKTVMSDYGFSDEELTSIYDARIYHVLNEFARLKGALNKVERTVKSEPKNKLHGNTDKKNASKVNRLDRQAKQAKNNYQEQQLKTAAIATLLGG